MVGSDRFADVKIYKNGTLGKSEFTRSLEGCMGILTEDMKRVVREQRLGFFATVCPDGSPNLSPKGTTIVLDDDQVVG